ISRPMVTLDTESSGTDEWQAKHCAFPKKSVMPFCSEAVNGYASDGGVAFAEASNLELNGLTTPEASYAAMALAAMEWVAASLPGWKTLAPKTCMNNAA